MANPAFPLVGNINESLNNFVATPDTRGGWYVGGNFSTIGGKTRRGIAQISSTGSVSSWQLPLDASVSSIVVTKNVICLGGGFRLGGGKSATILAVDAETGQNILWSYQTNATISSLVGKDSVLYVGGTFSSIGNQAREGLAALDIRTGAVLPWNPMGELSSLSSYRTSRLIVADSTIYVSGEAQFLQRNTRVFLSEFSLESV
jgi:hypothetical protein